MSAEQAQASLRYWASKEGRARRKLPPEPTPAEIRAARERELRAEQPTISKAERARLQRVKDMQLYIDPGHFPLDESSLKRIGASVRKHRPALMSVLELADACGVDEGFILALEAGHGYRMTREILAAICVELEVWPGNLL
jgi:hypothetical protein